jgi:uncharacterized protein YbjQ (UPF0145 family)
MHEYGHLLQDRTCLHGIVEFLILVDSIQSIVAQLKATNGVARLPMKVHAPDDAWLHGIDCLHSATNPRRPWTNDVWWAYESFERRVVDCKYGSASFGVPVAVARFVNNVNEELYEHEIGPREIKEAYSVALQIVHGGKPISEPREFEYLAVERVLATCSVVEARSIISVCHWALQSQVPGVRFFEIVETLRSHGCVDAEEIYDVLRDKARNDGLEALINQAEKQLADVVAVQSRSGQNDHFLKVLQWYANHAIPALRRNMDGTRRFPLDTSARAPSEKVTQESVDRIFSEEPVPLVETPDGSSFAFGGASLDTEAALFLRAIAGIVDQLWHYGAPEWPCLFCSTCGLDYKDATCEGKPWVKGGLRPACPYGAAVAYLGLKSVV